jgi:RNA polymerase sigma-70 factor (ECF subfamily)
MADAKVKKSGATAPLTEASLERYAAALNRYLARRARHAQDAPDMVQEIFARFLRKKDRPEVLSNPFGYLLGFARNVLLESLSGEQHNPVVYDSDLVDALAQNAEDPSLEPLEDRFGHQQELIDALSQLPEAHLLAITLVDGQGMSYEEAAKASGFTKATIATYVMHARASLRQILPDYWSDTSP